MINVAKVPPHKEKMDWFVKYYENMLAKSEVDLRLNTEATTESILALDPYAVVVAAGSNVAQFPVKGFDAKNILQARDVLEEKMKLEGKDIIVIGAGLTGIETGLYLKEQGKNLSLIHI